MADTVLRLVSLALVALCWDYIAWVTLDGLPEEARVAAVLVGNGVLLAGMMKGRALGG